jgi:hypothetical protein
MTYRATLSDRMAVLQTLSDHRDMPAVVQACEMWLRCVPMQYEPDYLTLNQPRED